MRWLISAVAVMLLLMAGSYKLMQRVNVVSPPVMVDTTQPIAERTPSLSEFFAENSIHTFSEYVARLDKDLRAKAADASDDVIFEAFLKAIAMQESGGNYNDINVRTGATGKYQIMPENWAGWAKEAGLPSNSPMSPVNQEIVARYKLFKYYTAYGIQGASVAWYAGEANGERWAKGMPDALSGGSHYSWNKRHGDGKEPSVAEYVYQVSRKVEHYLEG